MAEKVVKDNRLDVDAGYLTKSPCRKCNRGNNLPDCSKNCNMLSHLQNLLVGIISGSNNFSELETYSISQRNN